MVLLSTLSHAWLLPQTRREMFGTVWTATMTTLLDPTTATPEHPMPPQSTAANTATTAVGDGDVNDDKERAKRLKKEQQERDRIARETKARLAAGRIGTI